VEPSKIVARYVDGRIVKGYTQNFFPNKPAFHIQSYEGASAKEVAEIRVEELKAVFFVKDFRGDHNHKATGLPPEGKRPQGRLMEVTWKDGEIIVGTTTGYDPHRTGFFLFPVDPQSNNDKVFIVSASVGKVRNL
jgi:hypothetical protein